MEAEPLCRSSDFEVPVIAFALTTLHGFRCDEIIQSRLSIFEWNEGRLPKLGIGHVGSRLVSP